MSFCVDLPRRHGAYVMASISELHVGAHHLGGAIAGHAQKTPRIVVIFDGQDILTVPLGRMPVPSGARALLPDAAKALRDASAGASHGEHGLS